MLLESGPAFRHVHLMFEALHMVSGAGMSGSSSINLKLICSLAAY